MKVQKTFLALALWAALCGAASAQTVVEDPSGFRAQIPAGFTVRQDATGVVAGNADSSALVLKAHTYRSFDAFAADANLARDGFTLVGEPRALAENVAHFRASKPRPEGGYIIADSFVTFAPTGGGCLVVALANETTAEAAYQSAYSVVTSLEFTQPQATAASGAWDQALRGRHLVYLYTGNGYSERFDLILGQNGAFSTRSDASSVSMNGTGAVAGGGEGTWTVTPAGQLVLNYHNGRQTVYTLEPRQAGNEVSLNGKRFFVMGQ